MNTIRAFLLASASYLLLMSPTSLLGQASDWDRLIADGDAASAKKQYPQAEESYRKALQYAESHLKKGCADFRCAHQAGGILQRTG